MAFTPYDAATHAIARSRRLLHEARVQKPPALRATVRTDLRRLSVVMAVAALDTYMHRLIVQRAYYHDELPPALARVDVTFAALLEEADAHTVAARAAPHNSRPRVGVKRLLRDRLLRETFQRFEDVSQALAMIGRKGSWDAIGKNLNPPMSHNQIRERLNAIVTRRHQIVHEGDYRRLERPQDAGRNPMTQLQAEADIDFVSDLIDAIDAVV